MRKITRSLALLPMLSMVACGGGDGGGESTLRSESASELGRQFLLGYGETVDVGALSLEFIAVVDDSRCATDGIAVCVWEGNGRILLSATDGQLSEMLTLNTNSGFDTSVIFAGHVIELHRLDPQPVSTRRPDADDYAATLSVTGWVVSAGD